MQNDKSEKNMWVFDYVSTANKIKMELTEKHITASKMVRDLGLGVTTMSNMRHGLIKSVEIYIKIANYLGLSIDYLVGRVEEKTIENKKEGIYDSKSTAHRIKVLLAENELSGREFARICGLAPNFLSDIRIGQTKRIETFGAIANNLNVSIDYLVGLTDMKRR